MDSSDNWSHKENHYLKLIAKVTLRKAEATGSDSIHKCNFDKLLEAVYSVKEKFLRPQFYGFYLLTFHMISMVNSQDKAPWGYHEPWRPLGVPYGSSPSQCLQPQSPLSSAWGNKLVFILLFPRFNWQLWLPGPNGQKKARCGAAVIHIANSNELLKMVWNTEEIPQQMWIPFVIIGERSSKTETCTLGLPKGGSDASGFRK